MNSKSVRMPFAGIGAARGPGILAEAERASQRGGGRPLKLPERHCSLKAFRNRTIISVSPGPARIEKPHAPGRTIPVVSNKNMNNKSICLLSYAELDQLRADSESRNQILYFRIVDGALQAIDCKGKEPASLQYDVAIGRTAIYLVTENITE
jgi:hypothetical protein